MIGLFAAGLLLAAGGGGRPEIAEGREEPVSRRLIRTIYVGAPVGLTRAEIDALAGDSGAAYEDYLLAGGAALVVGLPERNPEWPVERRLEHALEKFRGGGDAALVFALARALATTGRSAQAGRVLANYAAHPEDPAGALALVALKQVGDAEANRALRFAAGRGSQLASNLVADTFTPYLSEPEVNSVPFDARDREGILRVAQGAPCECPAAAAAHLLGFLPRASEPDREARELRTLRALAGESSGRCFHSRYLALRALALRDPGTLDAWLREFDGERDAWTRDLIARVAFIRFGRAFLEPALERLGREPVQYVQWTLLHGNLALRSGAPFLDEDDLWNPVTLQYALERTPGEAPVLPPREVERMLHWLAEAGPADGGVRQQLFQRLLRDARGAALPLLVERFGRESNWPRDAWMLEQINDPAAVPALRALVARTSDPALRERLHALLARLAPPPAHPPAHGRVTG